MSALNKVCFNWEGIILFLKLLECEVEVLLERSKLELGGNLSAPKEQKNPDYLSQSFIPIIFFTVNLIIHSDCPIIM